MQDGRDTKKYVTYKVRDDQLIVTLKFKDATGSVTH